MILTFEIKRRTRQVVGPAIGCLLLGYFVFHSVEGDRGIHAWLALDSKIEIAESKLAVLKGEREALEEKVAMLHPESIDRDLLTERARQVLNYLDQNDFVISGMSINRASESEATSQKSINVRAISTVPNVN